MANPGFQFVDDKHTIEQRKPKGHIDEERLGFNADVNRSKPRDTKARPAQPDAGRARR